jgi:hypothetical protein
MQKQVSHMEQNSRCSSFVRMRNPASIPDLKKRITVSMETITLDMLIRVWQELDYRLDMCRVTKGANI